MRFTTPYKTSNKNKGTRSVESLSKSPKMYFKAIEELGNNIKSMQQDELQLSNLVSQMRTISGVEGNPMMISMQTLKKCNLQSMKVK